MNFTYVKMHQIIVVNINTIIWSGRMGSEIIRDNLEIEKYQRRFSSLKERLDIHLNDEDLKMLIWKCKKMEVNTRWDTVHMLAPPLRVGKGPAVTSASLHDKVEEALVTKENEKSVKTLADLRSDVRGGSYQWLSGKKNE